MYNASCFTRGEAFKYPGFLNLVKPGSHSEQNHGLMTGDTAKWKKRPLLTHFHSLLLKVETEPFLGLLSLNGK